MTEIEQLTQAIAALEARRALLGKAVVEAALAPMREKLAALQAHALPVEPLRRQVTILFADVSGFAALSETLDAEDVTNIMNVLWQRIDHAITAHGSRIDKHIGDAVMAVWGAEHAHENDPEQAIRAALDMPAALQDDASALRMRIGINTGPVLRYVWPAVDYQTQVQHEKPPAAAGRQTAVAQARHHRDRVRPVKEYLADRAYSPSQREQFCRQRGVRPDCLLSSTEKTVATSRRVTNPDTCLTRTDVNKASLPDYRPLDLNPRPSVFCLGTIIPPLRGSQESA